MARAKHVKPDDVNPAYLKSLRNQRRSLGLLRFQYGSDRNFSKWESKTDNIVIACFGEGSNQHRQYRSLVHQFKDAFTAITVQSFKPKMKDLLTNLIEELDLSLPKAGAATKTSGGVRVKNVQNQEINVSVVVNIDQTINAIIDEIKASEPDEKRVQEAEVKLTEFKDEMQSESPQWSKVKAILEWSLNFSRDVFLKILPILVEKYLQSH